MHDAHHIITNTEISDSFNDSIVTHHSFSSFELQMSVAAFPTSNILAKQRIAM
jgi:hypothetical protein